MTGPLVYVMGPSGAGKDSVLERARGMLSIEMPVVFAHRYITRPADVGGENHVALSRGEFALRRAHGLFAADLAVVVSGSREHYEKVAGMDPDLHPVLITAPPDKLKARLAARGREDAVAASGRLARSEAYSVSDPRLVTIVNDGALDAAAEAFIRALATLGCSPGARRRA
jgi:ribose 1,5-bisphosphokinase